MELHGKVALVTGGTGALGSVIIQRFLQEGANVAATYRSEDEKRASSTDGAKFFRADVTVETDVARLFEEVVKAFGRVDILVSTVGGFVPGKPVADVRASDWDLMMTLNLRSTFLCTREALRKMRGQTYGRIISISAMTGLKPSAAKSAYAISKAGIVLLTEIAAEEQKGTGITVNAIAPSIILTEANIKAMPDEDPSKWVKPEDIAASICYLCSDAAAGITGTTLRAFGGI